MPWVQAPSCILHSPARPSQVCEIVSPAIWMPKTLMPPSQLLRSPSVGQASVVPVGRLSSTVMAAMP